MQWVNLKMPFFGKPVDASILSQNAVAEPPTGDGAPSRRIGVMDRSAPNSYVVVQIRLWHDLEARGRSS